MWVLAIAVVADAVWGWRRVDRRVDRLPGVADLVDLLALGVRSGRDLRDALALAARHSRPELAGPLGAAVARIDRGESVATALRPMADLDPAVGVVVGVLGAAAESAESVAEELDRVRVDVVQTDTARTAASARRMAVWQTGPLVLCHLPAVAVLAIAPHLGW